MSSNPVIASEVPSALTGLRAAVDGLCTEWDARIDPFVGGAEPTEQLESMSDAGLLALVDDIAAVQQALDARKALMAGAIASRSGAERGDSGLAKSQGHASTAVLLSERWRVSRGQAKALCEVGTAVMPRRSFLGEVVPAEFPEVASAIEPERRSDVSEHGTEAPAQSRLTLDGAAIVVRELRKTVHAVGVEELALGERICVEHCAFAPLHEVRDIAGQVRDRLDQDGTEPREALQRQRRSCTISTGPGGMLDVRLRLDPESAAWVQGGIDGIVGRELRRPRFVHREAEQHEVEAATEGEAAPGVTEMPDPRTMEQRRADALVDVFRHAAGCSGAALELAPVTVVVRMDLQTLLDGVGTAAIDGMDQPISAGTARRMAVDARIVPMVLGGASQPLDLGYGSRLFSRAQKLALVERDGGCAWTGCTHPPSYTEAHHLRWWSREGPTDLDNGILLCTHHHHRVHADGWEIRVRDQVPWFIPPPHVDRSRTPRRGGRIRLDAVG
ncbi:DUF222 domain-containing protein [Plantibacter sp. YIM 135347]|uniref:HNH endonuclease signature motif containing protein n=1 Tax=Plantibacter sp. YIM 135347 TaxID=3423919 RepID=UPI003D32DBA9